MKIRINTHGNELPVSHGEWVDLYTAEDVEMGPLDFKIISLGVAMELPEGYYAQVVPRSSTCKNHGIIMANSIGIIEHSYCGNNDVWGFPAIAIRPVSASSSWSNRRSRLSLSRSMTSAIPTAVDGAAPEKADCEVDHGKAKRVSQA